MNGGGSADLIAAGGGDDTINGGAGNDALFGGLGTDRAVYTASRSQITSVTTDGTTLTFTAAATGEGTDTLTGFEIVQLAGVDHAVQLGTVGGNTLTGTAGSDLIHGNDGNDTIQGGAGADLLLGGVGTDTLTYAGDATGVTVNLLTGTASGGDAAGDVFSGFENLSGGSGDDVLTGDGNANTIDGNQGTDILSGGGGADTLFGNGGTDTLLGDNGDDLLYGGGEDDILAGGAGNDQLFGEGGIDTAIFLANRTQVVLTNTTGAVLTVDASATGAGVDTLTGIEIVQLGGVDHAVQLGGSGSQSLTGTAGSDLLHGGDGNDTIEGGADGDLLDGGAGTDTLSYAGDSAGVTVNLATNAASGGHAAGDVISGFENLTGGSGNDVLTGTASNNILIGGAGDDTIYSGDGADTLDGGEGSDVLYLSDMVGNGTQFNTIQDTGTTGTDTLVLMSVVNRTFEVQHDFSLATSGIEVIDGSLVSGETLFSNSESASAVNYDFTGITLIDVDLIAGTAHNDTIIGSAGDDRIDGISGSDTLQGAGGNDTFLITESNFLDLSADAIDGGTGTDTIEVQSGGTVNEAAMVNALSNIEVIDFTASGVDVTLDLQADEIQAMTDGSNVLRINVNAVGDSVIGSAGGGAAAVDVATAGSETTYTYFSDFIGGTQIAQLIVDEVA